jgi:hypothetical protein
VPYISVQANILMILATAARENNNNTTYLISEGIDKWVISKVGVMELKLSAIDVLADMCAGKERDVEMLIK